MDDVRTSSKATRELSEYNDFEMKYSFFEAYYKEFGKKLSDAEIDKLSNRLIYLFYIICLKKKQERRYLFTC